MAQGTAAASIAAGVRDPLLMEAALALHDNRLCDAEPLLRRHLKADPFDVTAMRMLAELAGRIGRYADAENLLRRALELAPSGNWQPLRRLPSILVPSLANILPSCS